LRAAYPNENVGEEGLFYATRAVRARTALGGLYTHANLPFSFSRREAYASQTWRMAEDAVIFGLQASDGRQQDTDLREYAFNVEALALPLAPRLVVSRQVRPDRDEAFDTGVALPARTFAELRLQLTEWPLYVHVGRVNWGKLVFSPSTLELGLEADRIGVEGKYQVALGEIRGFANHFRIRQRSVPDELRPAVGDLDNAIDDGEIRLTTRWRPWTREIKPFIGVHWRFSDNPGPYWSPRRYVLGFVGLEAEWVERYWSFTAQVQAGAKISGEAAAMVSGAVIAKRYLNDDWAVGLTAYAQSGARESK